jgi:glutaredoxin-related protein
MSRAVRDAVRTHKLLGQPIVTWRDGQVVVLPPEQIPLEPIGEPANHLS